VRLPRQGVGFGPLNPEPWPRPRLPGGSAAGCGAATGRGVGAQSEPGAGLPRQGVALGLQYSAAPSQYPAAPAAYRLTQSAIQPSQYLLPLTARAPQLPLFGRVAGLGRTQPWVLVALCVRPSPGRVATVGWLVSGVSEPLRAAHCPFQLPPLCRPNWTQPSPAAAAGPPRPSPGHPVAVGPPVQGSGV
jgi:hypothetical protein